jgi:hypothetical protein
MITKYLNFTLSVIILSMCFVYLLLQLRYRISLVA